MKTRNFQNALLAIATATTFAVTAGNAAAQDSIAVSTSPAAAPTPAAANTSAPQLSYGVPQVLQLVQAKVNDSVVVNYIQNSGTIYSLTAGEIVYLKQQGVSDPVLNAMLNQRSRITGSTEPGATTATSPNPGSVPATTVATQPTVAYVPATPSSTVYVIPDTQTARYNAWYYGGNPYYGYPYYGGYYYGWPAVSLSFGWGSYNYCGNGWHGGGYAGWHGGGYNGWHGGGYASWHGGSGGWHGGGGGGWHH